MRGAKSQQPVLFSYIALEARIPADHLLRATYVLLEPVLRDLAGWFAMIYADSSGSSIPPEHLLCALLL